MRSRNSGGTKINIYQIVEVVNGVMKIVKAVDIITMIHYVKLDFCSAIGEDSAIIQDSNDPDLTNANSSMAHSECDGKTKIITTEIHGDWYES